MVKGRGAQRFGGAGLSRFVQDLRILFDLPLAKKESRGALADSPFDAQLLSLSRIYRKSRKFYLELGGSFSPRVCSMMRSLSAQDLFADHIEYSPLRSELLWFKDHWQEVAEPEVLQSAQTCFQQISLFHEQNHRVVWRWLPPAPLEAAYFRRYLNFAESLVVTLDLALGDELGPELSPVFERMKAIYRSSGPTKWATGSKSEKRAYLLGLLYVTYLSLELVHPEDIPGAVDYVFPGQKVKNRAVIKRGNELSSLFTLNTNVEWQRRYWQRAQTSLASLHKGSDEDPLYLSEDPLDFEEEFVIANRLFDLYGI